MAHIQRTDRNPSDLGITEEVEELTSEEVRDEELTDEELSAIDGGGIGAIGGAVSSILGNISTRKPIDWGSAGSGAVQGAVVGSSGGLWGASLAGED
jgi:bacteriocin-like protein